MWWKFTVWLGAMMSSIFTKGTFSAWSYSDLFESKQKSISLTWITKEMFDYSWELKIESIESKVFENFKKKSNHVQEIHTIRDMDFLWAYSRNHQLLSATKFVTLRKISQVTNVIFGIHEHLLRNQIFCLSCFSTNQS